MIVRDILYVIIIVLFLLLLYFFIQSRINSVDHYQKFYDPKIDDLRNKLKKAIPEIKDIDIYGSNKSFTINKKHIHLCLRNKKGEYYNDNMLIYVLLHELAHVLCDEVGHTDKFKNIFTELLIRASKAGLYDRSIPPEDNYCE